MGLRGQCECLAPNCQTCRRRVALLRCKRWIKTPDNDTWLQVRKVNGTWGLGCKFCALVLKKRACMLPKVTPYAEFSLRSTAACQASHLERHSKPKFHMEAVKLYAAFDDPTAPSLDEFSRVLEHIVKHGAAPHSGIESVGRGQKIQRMVLCLTEACKRLDQRFMKTVKSLALARDERSGRLSIRFIGVNSDLTVRRGMMGVAVGNHSGGDGILRATDRIITDFSTVYLGMKRERRERQLQKKVQNAIHMVTVDAAANEVLAAELMRLPINEILAPLTPNLKIVLRDKAHGSRRTDYGNRRSLLEELLIHVVCHTRVPSA